VGRFAPAALVAALLVATAAAFAYTERLKLTPSPILGTRVPVKLFSPTCECDTSVVRIFFRLRRRDRVTVTMIDSGGNVVRTLVTDQAKPRGRVEVLWDGRDDAGVVVKDGAYKPRVKLALNRRTIVLPNPISVDTTPPRVELVMVAPRLFSPDGDGRSDRVVVTYRVNEPARGILYVEGRQQTVTYRKPLTGTITWNGRVDGTALPKGVYHLSVDARDAAGNLGARAPDRQVVLRYVALGRTRIVVLAGRRFALRVSADAKRVEWRLAGRSRSVAPGTIHIRAPLQAGRYTLTVLEHGHVVRAAVIVKARA
jgi:flagellar hook assembly protein FlgD